MRTFSEFMKEQSDKRRSDREEHEARRLRVLEYSKDTPALNNDVDAGWRRKRVREALANMRLKVAFYNLVCDNCGTELIDVEPDAFFATNPPKRSIVCPGCGWRDYFYGKTPVE